MPLDDENLLGTEKDGSKTHEYCAYCYHQGSFINPDMTLEDMRSVVKNILQEKKFPEQIIEFALKQLPDLKRWKQQVIQNVLIM